MKDIYNPWSIINYLDKKEVAPYWANTSSNSLIGTLIREGNTQVKESFELLLSGKEIITELDEQIVYDQLNGNEQAVWSLLLASGYLKVLSYEKYKTANNVYFNIIGTLSDSELNKINNYVDEYYKQWGKQYVRFNVNLKNQDTNNSSFSYGDNRFEKSQGSNWTFQE